MANLLRVSKVRRDNSREHETQITVEETQRDDLPEGKRPMNSPPKHPTPKRRRTLFLSETENATAELLAHTKEQSGDEKEAAAFSIAGKKRKDARCDNHDQAADPKILAARQMLRPRTPTPSQIRGKQSRGYGNSRLATLVSQESLDPKDLDDDQSIPKADLLPAVARELASFRAQSTTPNGIRKGSVTTQDFFNEAAKLMLLIRGQAPPGSGLDSVGESEEEYGSSQLDTDHESTQEPFERPPSREGSKGSKSTQTQKFNPRVVSHLRKYQENEDQLLAVASSLVSLHAEQKLQNPTGDSNDQAEAAKEGEPDEDMSEDVESDPPNIRIKARKQQYPTSPSQEGNSGRDGNEPLSTGSSASGATRTIPTNSSKASAGSRGMLPPNKLGHLIPTEIGGMTYDAGKKAWVKQRSSSDDPSAPRQSFISHESSEDPLAAIPDLTVDEVDELRKISAQSGQKITATVDEETVNVQMQDRVPKSSLPNNRPSSKDGSSRPHTREGAAPSTVDASSVPSKYNNHFGSSGPVKSETRATSWATNEEVTVKLQSTHHPLSPIRDERHAEEVEHEIRIHEGRQSQKPQHTGEDDRQARAVTITLSSPVISHVERAFQADQVLPDEDNSSGEEVELPTAFKQKSAGIQASAKRAVQDHFAKGGVANPAFRTSRRLAKRRTTEDARLSKRNGISRIDEHDEEQGEAEQSVILRSSLRGPITTPLQPAKHQLGILSASQASSSGMKANISFRLSPLSDFTVNGQDETHKLQVNRISKRNEPSSLRQVHGAASLAVEGLVKSITDIEPYEPFWDSMRSLSLASKGLTTLHKLDDFCERIEELDVSDNQIGELQGVPVSLRNLKIQRNCLSDMTAWAHLANLQYLDISGNEVESLEGFGSLVHLRELRADNNYISSVMGILGLDGLLKLSLRGNGLEAVDFEGAEL